MNRVKTGVLGERREKRGELAGRDVISEIRTEESRKRTKKKVNRTKRKHGWEKGNERGKEDGERGE